MTNYLDENGNPRAYFDAYGNVNTKVVQNHHEGSETDYINLNYSNLGSTSELVTNGEDPTEYAKLSPTAEPSNDKSLTGSDPF